MPEASIPLLTIAIPTYNRAVYLRELLEVLLPQLAGVPDVELLLCNNASTDDTAEVLRGLLPAGPMVRSLVQAENVGPDANFVRCFREARGKYLWLCGDDDVLLPGAVSCVLHHLRSAEYDLLYVAPEGFLQDWRTEVSPQPQGRGERIVRSAPEMMRIMNTMIAFVTAVIVNRDRALRVMLTPPEEFIGSSLVHLSWTLPLLAHHRQSLCLWQRWVAGRTMNSSFDVADVFGLQLRTVALRLTPGKPRLADILVNSTLRMWFPMMLLDMRRHQARNDSYGLTHSKAVLQRLFRWNPRYWFFLYPVLRLPLPAATRWQWIGAQVNRVIAFVQTPREQMDRLRVRFRPARSAKLVSPEESPYK